MQYEADASECILFPRTTRITLSAAPPYQGPSPPLLLLLSSSLYPDKRPLQGAITMARRAKDYYKMLILPFLLSQLALGLAKMEFVFIL